MEQLGSHRTDFHDIGYFSIFVQSVEIILVSIKPGVNNMYFTWSHVHIMIISRSVLLRMKNSADKCCRWNKNPCFIFNNFFFFENHAVYEILCKNISESNMPQMTIWRVRITCWIPKSTNTHSEYVKLIDCPLQHWLHERASALRCTCIACLFEC
jgi:hypothetical protein